MGVLLLAWLGASKELIIGGRRCGSDVEINRIYCHTPPTPPLLSELMAQGSLEGPWSSGGAERRVPWKVP